MNDLFSGSFSRFRGQDQSPAQDSHTIEMTNSGSTGGVNLDRFFEDVEAVKDELGDLESLYAQLQAATSRAKPFTAPKPSKTSGPAWTPISPPLSKKPKSSKSAWKRLTDPTPQTAASPAAARQLIRSHPYFSRQRPEEKAPRHHDPIQRLEAKNGLRVPRNRAAEILHGDGRKPG
ncbi:UNVERIFIED_CONTAM: syntaxin [Sesamum angustifolium]|uniref:Syntaxin n=1 Tax=Sesamum angustifolium TaxID=2727405 RepID=A0AAW2N6M2_9LAMI